MRTNHVGSTFLAFDTHDAGAVAMSMKRLGINIGTCGENTVRLRPMLIFEEQHSKFNAHASRTWYEALRGFHSQQFDHGARGCAEVAARYEMNRAIHGQS